MRSILSLISISLILLLREPIYAQVQPSQKNFPITKPAKTAPNNQRRLQSHVSVKPGLATVAKQALLVDYSTGTILLEKNADEFMYPSSMTKIMTAYLIFEKIKSGVIQLNTQFSVSERAWRMGGTKMFVPLNGVVSVGDLLKGIIIQSGNDACVVIAEGTCGSEEAFAEEMTNKAHEFGAMNTTFKNASGWPDPEHLTTAWDLGIIAHRLITDFPDFYHLFGMKDYTYHNIHQWNRNTLLYRNIGCDGIKTGFTDNGGYGVVASIKQGARRLILIINGLPSEKARAEEAQKLLMWGIQTFDNYPVFQRGQAVSAIPVWLGRENEVMATVAEDVSLTLPKSSFKGLKIDIQYDAPIAAPIKKDDVYFAIFW
jgi:serine-type D-Ala-D-Ala carboxypeptidase (penicillin-binding protein 5/6)